MRAGASLYSGEVTSADHLNVSEKERTDGACVQPGLLLMGWRKVVEIVRRSPGKPFCSLDVQTLARIGVSHLLLLPDHSTAT